jgi:hypothetical protein
MSEEGKELTGIAKTIFEEVMEEIEEEFEESLGELISKEKLEAIIQEIQEIVALDVTKTIEEHYKEDMKEIEKMILGEKLSRIVSSQAKIELHSLISEIMQNTMDLIDELRVEIIGEVFEETEEEEEKHAAS